MTKQVIPPPGFVQIAISVFSDGQGGGEDAIYGLDSHGRVWRWSMESKAWHLMPNTAEDAKW